MLQYNGDIELSNYCMAFATRQHRDSTATATCQRDATATCVYVEYSLAKLEPSQQFSESTVNTNILIFSRIAGMNSCQTMIFVCKRKILVARQIATLGGAIVSAPLVS